MASKPLVIVESPTKAKTLSRFLGTRYRVEASAGHIRDLPESASEVPKEIKDKEWGRLGVDVDQDFTPYYVIPADKRKQVAHLKAQGVPVVLSPIYLNPSVALWGSRAVAGAFIAAAIHARRRGAAPGTLAIVLLAVLLPFVVTAMNVRTQSFAYLPFVALVWVLSRDRPVSGRITAILLVVLMVWANVHGSALLAAEQRDDLPQRRYADQDVDDPA